MRSMSSIIGKVGKNVTIYKNVTIGKDVTIGDNAIIYDNVDIGDSCFIGPYCILGEPLPEFYHKRRYQNPLLKIGKNSIIRSGSFLYAGSVFGTVLRLATELL